MKKSFIFCVSLLLMFSGCSSNDTASDDNPGQISLSETSHSDCASHTRGDDEFSIARKLKLTYNALDKTITGEYINYILSCDYTDAGIKIEQDADGTLILNPWNVAENMVDCICHINIYFTIRNATMQNYHLILNRRTVTVVDSNGSTHQETWTDYDDYISFKDKSTVTIDL